MDHNDALALSEAMRKTNAEEIGKGSLAIFYDRAVADERQSKIEGRAVFKTRTFVTIRVPGDPRTVIDEPVRKTYNPVTDDPRLRWPVPWKAYLSKGQSEHDGTPIDQWPLLTVTQVAELKHSNVPTIEALASVNDANLGNLGPGARELRERARQFLQGSSDTEKELRATLDRQAAEITKLQAQLAALPTNDDDLYEAPEIKTAAKRKV